ncbi:MAG: glutamine synthetase [Bradyrhizobium sp.]|nr:glutamine synthetase [Bradyrhizobium sp.]
MNTSLNHGSAKIYQFPAGGRAALAGRRYDDAKAVTDLASSRASEVAVGGAWYHDAAIQDAKPVRER